MTTFQTLEARGRKAATTFLGRKGYEILEQDWTCKHGAIDLIANDNDDLVFVQVKNRQNDDDGLPKEAASKEARVALELLAASYLSTADVADKQIRFDAISILVISEERAFLRHHINTLFDIE